MGELCVRTNCLFLKRLAVFGSHQAANILRQIKRLIGCLFHYGYSMSSCVTSNFRLIQYTRHKLSHSLIERAFVTNAVSMHATQIALHSFSSLEEIAPVFFCLLHSAKSIFYIFMRSSLKFKHNQRPLIIVPSKFRYRKRKRYFILIFSPIFSIFQNVFLKFKRRTKHSKNVHYINSVDSKLYQTQ